MYVGIVTLPEFRRSSLQKNADFRGLGAVFRGIARPSAVFVRISTVWPQFPAVFAQFFHDRMQPYVSM